MIRNIIFLAAMVAFFAVFFATGGNVYSAPLGLLAGLGAVEVTARIIAEVIGR